MHKYNFFWTKNRHSKALFPFISTTFFNHKAIL